MSEIYYQVAVDAPLNETLTYLPPQSLACHRGQSVKVPLGKRKVNGLVIEQCPLDKTHTFQLKHILELDAERPLLPEAHIKWLEWLASYYMYPLGQVVSLAFPPLKKKGRSQKPVVKNHAPVSAPSLTPEQKNCIEQIQGKGPGFHAHLVFGITGSGKTEVYLRLLHKILAEGKRGLVLVPEISLTPQLIERFASRFPDQIAVIHSHLTPREKTNQWWGMVDGKKNILIGARSALFCPIPDLGLIVVDEEHEPSFKQDEQLRYNGRDAAVMLAKFNNCPIVLGSATPSLETWSNTLSGKYHLHKMAHRVALRSLPTVHVIDLKEEREKKRQQSSSLPFWLSEDLFQALITTFDRQEQAALFLNRRGVAQTALCTSCGHSFECSNCAIHLTLHGKSHLVCHYCDYSEALPEKCPKCQSDQVETLGLGTELLERDLAQLFPNLRIARADRDEIQSRQALEHMIHSMEKREIDLLIGTQMIAKGLDFPGLTLVGMVLADVGFNLPDFRASERSFQLLTQVSGRSGRHSESPGQVFIQTYNPEHPSVVFSQTAAFEAFAEQELKLREELNYPPFGRLALVRIQGMSLEKAELASQRLGMRAWTLKDKSPHYQSLQVLGPVASPLAKLRGKYRFQMLLKDTSAQRLRHFCSQILGNQKWIPPGAKVQIDIDPRNVL